MLSATIVIWALALLFGAVAYARPGDAHRTGLRLAFDQFVTVMPRVIMAVVTATFLGALRWAPLARYGSPFEKLRVDRQDAVLRWFEGCPVSLLRIGVWGLKAMVFMGYYGQPETNELVGYSPDFDGEAGLHA